MGQLDNLCDFWWQHEIRVPAKHRGCHLITSLVESELEPLARIQVGFLHIFILHTSASLTINENADPDVRRDMEVALNHICPENLPFAHTMEGPDDMPAHVKASTMGTSLTIPISAGSLALGTWQGIYLNEHRNHGGSRRLMLTLVGRAKS